MSLRRLCPACSGFVARPIWHEGDHRYVVCSRCRAVFTDVSAAAYETAQHNVWDDEDVTEESEAFYVDAREAVHRALLARLEIVSAPGRRLLDVGCGLGAFVERAVGAGWEAYGCEPSATWAARACDRVGHSRIACAAASPTLFGGEQWSVITLWDVLEHVHDPLAVLRTLKRMLAPDGVLFIRTPNIAFLLPVYGARRRLGDAVALGPLNHVVYFGSWSMRAALQAAGLRPFAWPVLVPPQVPVSSRGTRSASRAPSVVVKNAWAFAADRLAARTRGTLAFGSDLDVFARPASA